MSLDEIKALVAEARSHIERYNELANKLAEAGVTIELDTSYGRTIHASFMLELD